MDEEVNVLRAGEAVLNRRRKSRKRREDMDRAASTESSPTVNWFKTMLSIPPRKTLTTLHIFSAWSAFLAYFLAGSLSVLFPQPMNYVLFDKKLGGRAQEYMRLGSGLLALIGFLNIVSARSRPLISGNGSLLGTVPERLFFVTAVLMWNLHQSLVPLLFVVVFITLDSTLSVILYVIWSRNTPGASPRKCLKAITKLMLPVFNPARKWSSNCVQMIGYFQIVTSLTFLAKPEIARDALGLDEFEEYSKGLLSLIFMETAIIGWLHVLGGGDGNESTPIAAFFYRLAWSFPLISTMYYYGRIERGFAIAAGIADSLSAFVILACLCCEAFISRKLKE